MKTAALISICLVATGLAKDPPAMVSITKETAFTFYRPFKRLTKEPHYVSKMFWELCTAPPPELIERDKRETGPHFRKRIHTYANALADDTFTRKLATFPPGAIIVKEKLAADGAVSAVGGMVKRAGGLDTKNGDWEYFYSDKATDFSIGRLQNCAECHAKAKATDYVYTGWKPFVPSGW